MRVFSAVALGCALLASSPQASAQPYGQPYGQPPPGGYGPPPRGGYGPPPGGGYGGYNPPPPPPRQPPPEPFLSIRINPIDIFFKRLSLEGEVALPLPVALSLEIAPSYIFGVPGSKNSSEYDTRGAGGSAKLGIWVQGTPLDGFFIKGLVEHMRYSISSDYEKDSFGETAYGLLIGSQRIFGGSSGFTFSGGFGAKAISGATDHGLVIGNPDGAKYTCGDRTTTSPMICFARPSVELIGQLALGYTF